MLKVFAVKKFKMAIKITAKIENTYNSGSRPARRMIFMSIYSFLEVRKNKKDGGC